MHFLRKKEGFALITALLFMGFLITLITTISVLLNLDFHFQENALLSKEAKGNALIGLQIALAEAQKNLGSDIPKSMSFNKKGEILDHKGQEVGYYSYVIEDISISKDSKHDLGVLSDPAHGGLKQNLTSYLLYSEGLKDEGAIIKDRPFSPKWGILKSFYKICKEYSGSNNLIDPIGIRKSELLDRKYKEIVSEIQDPITTTHGIGPIILGLQFGLNPVLYKDEDAGFNKNMDVQYFLTVELWNPYAYDLKYEEYLFEISSKRIDDKSIDSQNCDNILFLNENQKCRLDCEKSLVNPMHNCIFRAIINSSFKSGETKSFTLSSTKNNLDIKNGNLLIEKASNHNFVLDVITSPLQGGGRRDHDEPNFSYRKKESEKEKSRMRGGGKAPPKTNSNSQKQNPRNVQTIFALKWGGNSDPEFSFSLALKKDPSFIFQEVKELKVEGCRLIQNPNIINNVKEGPLISFFFENIITRQSLEKYNPRSPIIWIHDNNIVKSNDDYNYRCEFFLEGIRKKNERNNSVLFYFPKEFNSLSAFHHCNVGLHENNPAAVCGNSLKNVYIENNKVPYLYDLPYYLNKTLWDSYFLMEESERFFKLSSGHVLLKETLNVNSTTKERWAEALFGLTKSPYNLKKEIIELLAKEIANQVKIRGPFKTIAEFINRPLDDKNKDQCGLLQSALNNLKIPLYQYEVLDLIGDKLTVRSDTFRIRITGGKEKGKSACCEVWIQRVPDYMDNKQNKPEDKPEKLNPINKRFGRRFKIISLRWLF